MACRELARNYDSLFLCAICFEHKTQYILLHAPYSGTLWYFDISVICPLKSRRVDFVTIPPYFYSSRFCEILLYNCQLVVIMYELIYVVQATHR